MRRSTRIVAATAVGIGAMLGACGDDLTPEQERARLVENLAEDLVSETEGTLTVDSATCVAGRLIDQLGVDAYEASILAAAGGPDDELQVVVIETFASCGALAAILDDAATP